MVLLAAPASAVSHFSRSLLVAELPKLHIPKLIGQLGGLDRISTLIGGFFAIRSGGVRI